MEKLKEVTTQHMSFLSGFAGPPSEYEAGFRQVDWKKATQFIADNIESIENVEVGLAEDFGHTSQLFWDAEDGFQEDEGIAFWGSSSWATPAIRVEYKDGTEKSYEC